MIINQRSKNKRTAIGRVFRCVGFLLLIIFIGRVALVAIYGYAGVPKLNVSTTSGNAEEQNDDKKEESKYTEKQFKCITQDSFVLLIPVYTFLSRPSFHYATGFIAPHAIAVLTPPPNC
jgi:hypothetical protein